MKWLSQGLSALAELFLPRYCLVCDTILSSEDSFLCTRCMDDLPHTYHWQSSRNPMADRLNALMEEVLLKNDTGFERYAYAAALFLYRADSGYRKIPHEIKYRRNIRAGRHFGQMLGSMLAKAEYLKDVDMIIPVPLHPLRMWSRGYNQAGVLAEGVASVLGVPIRTDILKRGKMTKTQTRLDLKAKRENVKGAFHLTRRFRKMQDESWPEIRHILLIDDVFTTGSTLGECFWALREAFPPSVRISVATLGFVEGV